MRLREQLRHPPTTLDATFSDPSSVSQPHVSSGSSSAQQNQNNVLGANLSPLGFHQPNQFPECPSGRKQQKFYDKDTPLYGFTNFSDHTVVYSGKTYPTSEHLFQAFKFIGVRDDIAEDIRTLCPGPRDAFNMAHREYSNQRRDWQNVRVGRMRLILQHKFSQHRDLAAELLSTGDDELIEDSPVDFFWGCGKDGTGRNGLGKQLEKVRDWFRVYG